MSLPQAPLEALVVRAFGSSIAELSEMPGGASTRRYYRVLLRNGATAVAMFAPDGEKPEEVSSGGASRRWPFLEVRDLLESRGVRVPTLHGEDTANGLLLLEDLGDVTLAAALRASPSRREVLYTRAVRDLASMHRAVADTDGTVVATRAFDETLLRWELAHFVEWGLDARGVVRTAAARRALDEAFDVIARELAARPRGFVQRDYQSRNLRLDPNGAARGDPDALVVIDFQDALLGPRAYDMVALLRDSYQDLDEPFVDRMLSIYGQASGFGGDGSTELRAEFDRLTVQRKLKDAGRFVFIERKKNDPSFLPYIAPSLSRVALALQRLRSEPAFARVEMLLAEALPQAFA